MSKSFLKVSEAYNKLGLSGGGTNWIRKSELIATGKCIMSLLEKYGNNDFVVDDDIVTKTKTVDILSGNITFSKDSSHYGYYVGRYGSFKLLSNITKCDGLHTLHVDTGTTRYFFNMHLRSLVPTIYNDITIKFQDGISFQYNLTYSSSDFNWVDDANLCNYINSKIGVNMLIIIELSHI